MKQTSEQFKQRAENPYGARYYIRITDNRANITQDIEDYKYEHMTNDNDAFVFGNTASALVSFSIIEPTVNLNGKEIEIYQGMNINGTVEEIKQGIFKVLKPTQTRDKTSYQAVDKMTYEMNMPYFSQLQTPTTDIDILSEICTQSGIILANSDLVPHTIEEIPNGYTKREIIAYLSQLQGKNAIINSDGNLELIWYKEVDYTVNDDKIYYDGISDVNSETNYTLGYIECTVRSIDGSEEKILRVGNGINGIKILNPFMTQEILDEVFSVIGGFSFMPSEFEFLGDFRLEVGDIVTVETNNKSYKVPIMQLTQKSDGGVITTIASIAETDSENEIDMTSPSIKAMERYYANLVLINKALVNKLSVDDADIRYAKIDELDVIEANVANAVIGRLQGEFADIHLANIDITDIGKLFADVGLITSATIVDGHITGYLDAVEINADKITAGTLSVDRLIFRGGENSIIYELNNITGALQAIQGDTLNGEIITDRSITVDKIVAKSITANEIASGTITGNEILAKSLTSLQIDVENLFAQDITATGSITGAKLYGAYAEIDEGNIGSWHIDSGSIVTITNDIIFRSTGALEYDLTDIVSTSTHGVLTYMTNGKEKITLSAGENNVYLEFASVDNLERNTMAYQINLYGIEKTRWSSDFTTSTTKVILGYLDDGIYTPHLSTDRIDVLNVYVKDLHCYNGTFATIYAKSSNYGALTIERAGSTNSVGIRFKNNNGLLGSICMSTVDGGLYRYNAAESGSYKFLDAGNYSDYVVPKSGGQFTGRIQVPMGQGGTYLDSVTTKSRASIYVYNAASASSYHPIITGVTSSGHTWNLGAIGDTFGFTTFKANKTINGVDYYCWWDIAQGYMGTTFKIKVPKIEFGSNFEYGLDESGQVWASNVYLGNTKSIFCYNSEGNPINAVMMASYDVLHLGYDASGITIGNHGLTKDASMYVDNEVTLNAPKVRIGEYNTAGETSAGVALWSSGAVTISGSVPEVAFRYNNSVSITANIYESSLGVLTATQAFRCARINFGTNYGYALDELGQVWAGNVYIGNGNAYFIYNTAGNSINSVYIGADNILRFGYGASDIWIGAYGTTSRTIIFGTRIDFCANTAGTSETNPAISLVSGAGGANLYFRPTSTQGVATYLGDVSYRFNTVYCQTLDQSSDKNDKKNICDISDKYIELWDKLSVKTFRYINDDKIVRVGLIAQDVEQSAYEVGLTLEQCGFISKTWVEDENYTGYKYGLDYLGIAMITVAKLGQIVKIVSEHDKKIQDLENEVAILKATIISMKAQMA